MKKLVRGAIVGILALSFAKMSHAASFTGIDLHFQLNTTLTLTIPTASTSPSVGALTLNMSTVTASSITVQNASSAGQSMTFALQAFNYGTSWTTDAATSALTAVGTDKFNISGMWNNQTRPAVGAFAATNRIVTGAATASGAGSGGTWYDGLESGAAVPSSSSRGLWLMLATPSTNTKVTPGNEIVLLVNVLGIAQ
jgi:hypothetical protein